MNKTRTYVIGIRVNKEMKDRLTIRAMRNEKSVSDYCYNLLHKDIYRKDSHNAPVIDSSASGKE